MSDRLSRIEAYTFEAQEVGEEFFGKMEEETLETIMTVFMGGVTMTASESGALGLFGIKKLVRKLKEMRYTVFKACLIVLIKTLEGEGIITINEKYK